MPRKARKYSKGGYNDTSATSKVHILKNGIKRDLEEFLLELDESPLERLLDGGSHGMKPIGNKRTGKLKVIKGKI